MSATDLVVTPRIRVPFAELEFSYSRSGGPGGQNVNKLNTKATLRWNLRANATLPEGVRARFLAAYGSRLTNEGELLIVSQRHRDAPGNARDCLDKLRAMLLAVAMAPKVRRPTKPTRSSVERRHADKRERSERKRNRRAPGAE